MNLLPALSRCSVSLIGFFALYIAQVLSIQVQAAETPPSVLLVYVDDLGYGDTGAYSHPIVKTPHIDRLAREGIRFTQFYAPSALCSPSRAGLLTGRTPYRTGVEDWIPENSAVSLGANERTLAALAREAGYRTAVIGKWHLNGGLHLQDAPQPKDFAFDYQYGLDAWVKNMSVERQRSRLRQGHLYPDNMFRNNQPVGPTQKYSAELVSDEAISWIAKDDQPFFLYLTYSEVHTPIASPPEFLAQYDAYRTPEARENPLLYYFDWRYRPWRGRGEYYANISYLDAQLGRVIKALRDGGRLENTLVIFSSDNGPVTAAALTPWELGMAGETAGLRGKKRFLFEGGIRVPGIMRFPSRIQPGMTEDRPVTALDLFPTLAALWGSEMSAQGGPAVPLDGQSLWPLIEGKRFQRRQPLYWSIATPDGMEYALRDGDWKLIANAEGQGEFLFNLADDFYEVDNRLEAEPERRRRLERLLNERRGDIAADPLRRARENTSKP